MERPRTLLLALCFGTLTTFFACAPYRVAPGDLHTVIAEEKAGSIRVTLNNGERRVVKAPTMREDTLFGGPEKSIRIPAGQVTQVEVRRFSLVRTIGAVLLIPAAVAGVYALTIVATP